MTTLETIIKVGERRDSQALHDVVHKTGTDELTQLITKRIQNANFSTFFGYLLDGFDDTSQSHDKRYKSVMAVLKQLRTQSLPSALTKGLLVRLCVEMNKFKSEHLVELCSYCMEGVQKGDGSDLIWKELLPILLDNLTERKSVEYNEEEISGLQYKNQLLSSLLVLEWSPNIVTPLTDMFITMSLTKDEHIQVVNKLGQYMEKLTPQELPTFVYQMLRLCKTQNGRPIFLRLQNYFGLRIYSKPFPEQNSESMDIIESSSSMDAIHAESTILYHIHESASLDQECVKDYLASLKNLMKAPEFILHPFQLTVLLSISTISLYEERAFEIVKSSIYRSYIEEHKREESSWLREMVPKSDKTIAIMTQIITLSVQGRDVVLQGLVNLSFVLLSSGAALGRENITEKMWHLGTFIILKLIKKKRYLAHTIIQRLSNYIITAQNPLHYTDCLQTLTKKFALVMIENMSCIIELIDKLIQLPGHIAGDILDAIMGLTKTSHTIRDHLILVLRKSLYSRSVETRQMAVGGFLKLIKNMKFSNLAALSQSSSTSEFSSGHSVFTQISLSNVTGRSKSNAFTNEALCFEVLSILRRCFMQQAEVKTKLYDGLHDAVSVNPELGVPLLDLIKSHLNTYYESHEEVLPPLKFSALVQLRDLDAILTEPVGVLLHSTASILAKVKDVEEENATVTHFELLFDELSQRMAKCEPMHLELDDGTDLLDDLPECQLKALILAEALTVFEALIGYNIDRWSPDCTDKGDVILRLFQGYNRFVQFTKNLSKSKKGDKKKSPSKSTQANDTMRKEGSSSKKSFKFPRSILNFKTLDKILGLLHQTTVNWTTSERTIVLRRDVDVHRYFMQVTINQLKQLKSMKHINVDKKGVYYSQITPIAAVLQKRCVSRLDELSDFDTTTAYLAVEAFYSILQVVNTHYKDKWVSFLSSIVSDNTVKDDLNVHLGSHLKMFQNLFETLNDDTTLDADTIKYYLTIMNSIKLLGSQISSSDSEVSNKLLEWMKNIAIEKRIRSKVLMAAFLNFMFSFHVQFKSTATLFKNFALRIADVIGRISEEEVNQADDIAIINGDYSNIALQSLCNEIKSMLDDIDWIVLRIRSEYCMITFPGEDGIERRKENLKSKERSVCCQISQIISLMIIISDISVAPGPFCELLIKSNTHLYNSLTNLAKYFLMRSTKVNVCFQAARFDSVVKQAGKQLAPVVYRLPPFIEQNQKDADTATQRKRKADANVLKTKVLRETRLIPKMIFEMEQFSKTVIQISTKTKVDLSRYMGQGTTRDFRILNLQDVLNEAGNAAVDDSDHSDAEASTVVDDESRNSESEIESGPSTPPKKRARK